MIEDAQRPKIYFDTTIFLSAFEAGDDISQPLRRIFDRATPGRIVTSEITLAEVLGKESVIYGWAAQTRLYLNLLVFRRFIDLRPITRNLLLETGEFRRTADRVGRKVKLPDAVHLVTAIDAGCSYLFSADKRFFVPNPIEKITFDAVGFAPLRSIIDA